MNKVIGAVMLVLTLLAVVAMFIFFHCGNTDAKIEETEAANTNWKAESQFPFPQLEKQDDETLLKLFNRLDFVDLLEFANISPRFRSILNETLISKFQINEKFFKIGRSWEGNITLTATSIECSKYDTVLKVLRNFCGLITKLEFDSYRNRNLETEEITRHINKYCSKSLREIVVIDDRNNVIEQFNETFDKVENVTLRNIYYQCYMKIHKNFPMMRRLEAQIIDTLTNITFLEHNFPNLLHLSLEVMFVENNYLLLNNLLRLNPQITTFHITNLVNLEFLRGVNEFLPRLETLKVASIASQFFGTANEIVHFKNLKNFQLFFYYGTEMPDRFPFAFDKLESLELSTGDMPDNWLTSVAENEHLKKLILPRNFQPINYSRLSKIFKNAPHINEIRLRWDRTLKDNGIDRLMNDENQLGRIFIMVPFDDHQLLLENVPATFKVIENKSYDIETPKTSYLVLVRNNGNCT